MITSSPGSTSARMVDSIASVTPQQTVISVSGSTVICRKCLVLVAIASRITLAPQVVAYWLKSLRMASTAASLSSAGAAKSGKPWARLRQPSPCSAMQSRVISRITDSVNSLDLLEIIARGTTLECQSVAPNRPGERRRGVPQTVPDLRAEGVPEQLLAGRPVDPGGGEPPGVHRVLAHARQPLGDLGDPNGGAAGGVCKADQRQRGRSRGHLLGLYCP